MDSDPKYLGKGILLILTAVILIFLLVYFINNKPGSVGQGDSSSQTASSQDGENAKKTVYGVQIGDNLKGFLRDADFFDIDMNNSNLGSETEAGDITQANTPGANAPEGTNPEISYFVQAGEGEISVTFVDEASCVVTGARLSIALSRKAEFYTAELTYVDEDGDGVITAGGLSPGIWEMRVNTLLGYRVPTDVYEVALDVDPDELEDGLEQTTDADDTEETDDTEPADDTDNVDSADSTDHTGDETSASNTGNTN